MFLSVVPSISNVTLLNQLIISYAQVFTPREFFVFFGRLQFSNCYDRLFVITCFSALLKNPKKKKNKYRKISANYTPKLTKNSETIKERAAIQTEKNIMFNNAESQVSLTSSDSGSRIIAMSKICSNLRTIAREVYSTWLDNNNKKKRLKRKTTGYFKQNK